MKKRLSLFLILTVLTIGSGACFGFDKETYYKDEIGNIEGFDGEKTASMITQYEQLYDDIFSDKSEKGILEVAGKTSFNSATAGFIKNGVFDIKYAPIYNLYLTTLTYKFNPNPIDTFEYIGGMNRSGDRANFVFAYKKLEDKQKKALDIRIDEEYKKLQTKIHRLDSPIEKAIKITHHFNQIKYDKGNYQIGYSPNNNLYGALINGTTQCNGFSILLDTFLEKFNVKSDLITGNVNQTNKPLSYGDNSFAHVWNLVQLGQKWYHVDTTWYYDYVDTRLNQNVYSKNTLGFSEGSYNPYNLFFASNKQIKDYQIVDNYGRYFILDKRVNPAEDEAMPYSFEEYNKVYASLKLQELYDRMYNAELGEISELELKSILSDADYLAEKSMISDDMKERLLTGIKRMYTLRHKSKYSPKAIFKAVSTDFSAYDMSYFK